MDGVIVLCTMFQCFPIPRKLSASRKFSDSNISPAKALSDGRGPSSRANTRDIGRISLFVRNDNALPSRLCVFARDIPRPTGARSAPYENLRALRAFVVKIGFASSVAAAPRWVLRGKYLFKGNPDGPRL